MPTIQIINTSHHALPDYQTAQAIAFDVQAFLPDAPITLQPLDRVAVPTGLFMAIPDGYDLQVRSRSGMTLHHGIMVINAPGTIDPDYRGEVKVLLINLSKEAYDIKDGDRIAQLLLAKTERVVWQEVEELDKTERQAGGFGHTGR